VGPGHVATSPPSERERERRAEALQRLLDVERLDVLVLAANDYRGHKGVLRWVGDYNLAHRYGFALAAPGREPELLLPENLAMARRGGWDIPIRYVRRTDTGLVERLRELGPLERIGVVGLTHAMKVQDYLALREAFPAAEIVDAGDAFEHVRARKSEEEIEGVREAARIADACFERLLEVTHAGTTERAVGAAMYECAYGLGGEDPLFLIMDGKPGDGGVRVEFGPPGDRVLEPGSLFIFSFELIGRSGYWMELSRMVTIGPPTELQLRMNAAVRAGLAAAAERMQPGARPQDVQRAILEAVEAEGARSAYWSGHGIGLDVIEEPWVGLEVVQDAEATSEWVIEPNMAISLHPFVADVDGQAMGYMAETFITSDGPAEACSQVPLSIHVVG
jgi:Xaa-Pro aminopeptidase